MAKERGVGFAILAGTATAAATLDFFIAVRSDFFVIELLSEGALAALVFVPILYT